MSERGEMNASPATLQQLEQARRSGMPVRQTIESVARTLQLPIASVRGAASSYSDLSADPGAIRVCRGTSCMLAGASDLSCHLNARHACRTVYCVGYCDRSPALLMPDDRVAIQCRTDKCGDFSYTPGGGSDRGLASHPPPPDVRCAARAPIVTGRLMQGGCADLSAARGAGVYQSLETALRKPPSHIIDLVDQSGLRGRGGAGFLTGRKWRTAARAPGDRKYIIANGDEGDPGSFIDRELMERDPHSILEGMILAAYAVGASEGIVFIRSEYPRAIHIMRQAIEDARNAGLLGSSIAGFLFAFDVRVVTGLGSYVCGEETAMLNAIEGKRGEARPRPPYPAECGLFGKPTVVNNVETLVNVPWIVRNGAAAFRAMGTAATPGTKAICLNHGFARPGIVEVDFGTSLKHVIDDLAGGPAQGKTLDAVLLGGPMGCIALPTDWDVPVCMDAMTQRGLRLGHAGLVALPNGSDYAMLLRHMLEFMAEESCGKCVPCSLGTQQALALIQNGGLTSKGHQSLVSIFHLMEQASLCGFGRETPGPVRQLLEHFGAQILKEVGR